MKIINKIANIKIFRPITLPILGFIMVVYIIFDYIFNIEE